MTLTEMHVWFRQYAQQMGLQNVRAILPEQIDLLINTSITDTVNQLIRDNIGVTNDRVITDNSKIGQLNALRSLYKVIEVNAVPENIEDEGTYTPFIRDTRESLVWVQSAKIEDFTNDGTNKYLFKYLFLVDLSIKYNKPASGQDSQEIRTNYFPVRLIDDAFLSDTLNDFILRPRFRSPVAVIYNDQIDLYIDNIKDNKLPSNLVPYKLRVSYIGMPNKVKYTEDIGVPNVECDLPDYLHIDILKHAVDLWRVAVSGSLYANQQQEQAQQQEIARNNYRNDGNQ